MLYLQCIYVENLKVSKINRKCEKSNIKIYLKIQNYERNYLKKIPHAYENTNLL